MDLANTDRANGIFALRCDSAVDLEPHTQVILETVGATPETPYQVSVSQILSDFFSGESAQFDLIECNPSELNNPAGQPSDVTLSTKDGVAAGITFPRVITADKVYRVVFVPGKTGDGTYSITVQPAPIPE